MLPSVARSASVRCSRPEPKNSTNLPTTPCLRSRSVIVSTRSVAVVPSGNWPDSFTPSTGGISIDEGCPSIAASASMPPDAPTHHSQSVHHRRMRVGADERVGICERAAVGCLRRHDDTRQIFEIHLMDDAGIRRDDAEVVERVLSPAQKRVALLIARELELGVQLKRVGLAGNSPPEPNGRSPARRAGAG